MNSEPNLKPLTVGFTRPYLNIHVPMVRESVAKLVSQSEAYFSKPLDSARFALVTAQGALTEDIKSSDTNKPFDLIRDDTLQLRISLSVALRTSNLGLTMIPDEVVNITIDFQRHTFTVEIATAGLDKANQIGELLSEGVVLITVQLPQQHQYLEPFLESFLKDHPQPDKNVFLVMRFKEGPPFPEIIEAVRGTCAESGLEVLRADDKEYTDDLLDNVLTYMYGCDQAIAIFDQINYREFNPDVALEVGFLLAQCKRVLLLKDKAIPVMPADIVGKIYRPFDTYVASTTIPPQIRKWLQDYGIGESKE